MSPYAIQILMHYRCSPRPWKDGSEHWLPLDVELIETFVTFGLLIKIPHPDIPGATKIVKNEEALRVYVDALEAVPLPVCRWVLPT